jgi:hypothetical protein
LISGDTIQKKVTDKRGALAGMKGRPVDGIVEELYLRTLSRYPDAEERQTAAKVVAKAAESQRGLEDVFWALLNSKEFLYNH